MNPRILDLAHPMGTKGRKEGETRGAKQVYQTQTWQDKSATGDPKNLRCEQKTLYCPVGHRSTKTMIMDQYPKKAGFKGQVASLQKYWV
jgi:hypothetical protein